MKSQKLFLGVAVGIAFAAVLGMVVFNFMYRSKTVTGNVIADDIQKLATIFEKIHKECGIISFDYQQNPINFLNVAVFTSSEVGSMNLAHADKWQGPYVDDNLAVQGKEYMVVRTEKGYFITPGNGVELPNGMVIGTDIILNEAADIQAMMRNPQKLLYENSPLAAPIMHSKSANYLDMVVGQDAI